MLQRPNWFAGALQGMGVSDALIVTIPWTTTCSAAICRISLLSRHTMSTRSACSAFNRVLLTKAAIAKIEESYK